MGPIGPILRASLAGGGGVLQKPPPGLRGAWHENRIFRLALGVGAGHRWGCVRLFLILMV